MKAYVGPMGFGYDILLEDRNWLKRYGLCLVVRSTRAKAAIRGARAGGAG